MHVVDWLLASDEPWTRYRTRLDLLDQDFDDPAVKQDREDLLAHPAVRELITAAAGWPGHTLKRHNDASHPIHTLAVLADFGITRHDPGMETVVARVLAHQDPAGPFETMIHLPKAFGGSGEDQWAWMACDAPTLLYAMETFSLRDDARIGTAVSHLLDLGNNGGWGCAATPALGARFKGPGRRDDPCPLVCLIALKALAGMPEYGGHPAVKGALEMLLTHWERRAEQKYFLFAMGTDFRKLKYPFIWYDLLHVTDVVTRYDSAGGDGRLAEMVDAVTAQADEQGRYTATSMYRAWSGWSFADKKAPSPWLTFLATRLARRIH